MTLEESVTEMVVRAITDLGIPDTPATRYEVLSYIVSELKARDYPDPWWYLDCLCILTIWKLEGRHLITS